MNLHPLFYNIENGHFTTKTGPCYDSKTSKQCKFFYFVPGFLGKSVEDLSKAVTDLLVRQKQVTVGMPPHNEVIVSGGVALKSNDLICTIHNAFKGTVLFKNNNNLQ